MKFEAKRYVDIYNRLLGWLHSYYCRNRPVQNGEMKLFAALLLFLSGCVEPVSLPDPIVDVGYAVVGEEKTAWGHTHYILNTGTRRILVEKGSTRVYDDGKWVKVDLPR